MIRAAIAACLALALGACAGGPAPKTAAAPAHPEARVYDVKPDAMGEVDAALARASANGKRVLLVMGANWCHDSRALAGWLETPRFTALVAKRYELVFVNVGMPQSGDGHNLDVAQRFGLNEFPGTPAVLVLTTDGQLVNPETAASWRNAASRSEDAIFAELEALAGPAEATRNGIGASVMVHVRGDKAGCEFSHSPEGPWFTEVTGLPGARDGVRFDLRSAPGAPWRCVAAGIYALQQSGAAVGFVSDPTS